MASLTVRVRNVYGEPLDDVVDVCVHPAGQTAASWAQDVPPGGKATFTVKHEAVVVKVFPARCRAVSRVVMVHTDELDVEFVCPVDAERVVGYRWGAAGAVVPPQEVEGLEWDALTDLQRAGFLNVFVKARATALGDGRMLDALLTKVREVRQDRTFFDAPVGAAAAVAGAATLGLLTEAPGALHPAPPGYEPAGSWKTHDSVGNLQYTGFAHKDGDREIAELDVDENLNAVLHLFDVIKHHATGRPTHPADIHQILTYAQGLELGYLPVLA